MVSYDLVQCYVILILLFGLCNCCCCFCCCFCCCLSLLVTYIGRGGFWEGRSEGKEGWFPRLAIKELGDEEFDYSTLTREAKPKPSPSANSEVAMQSSAMDTVNLSSEDRRQPPPTNTPSPPDSSPYGHHKFMK